MRSQRSRKCASGRIQSAWSAVSSAIELNETTSGTRSSAARSRAGRSRGVDRIRARQNQHVGRVGNSLQDRLGQAFGIGNGQPGARSGVVEPGLRAARRRDRVGRERRPRRERHLFRHEDASGRVDASRERVQDLRREMVEEAARQERPPAGPDGKPAARGGELPRDAEDHVDRDARLGGDALEAVVLLEQRSQRRPPVARILETGRSLLDEFLVVEALGDDHARDAERENALRAGPDGDPLVRRGGRLREPRLDLDQLAAPSRPALAELTVRAHRVHRRARRFQERRAEREHVVGRLQVVGGCRAHSLAEEEGEGRRRLAAVERHVVRRAERGKEPLRDADADPAHSAPEKHERLRAPPVPAASVRRAATTPSALSHDVRSKERREPRGPTLLQRPGTRSGW